MVLRRCGGWFWSQAAGQKYGLGEAGSVAVGGGRPVEPLGGSAGDEDVCGGVFSERGGGVKWCQ